MLLLSSTEWVLIAAVSGWLVAAWLLSRPDPAPLRAGLLFAAILATGAFVFAIGGGLGLDAALRRALRAALLVLTATWLRAAAGAGGLREVSRRALGRLRAIPSAVEAAQVLQAIASEGRLAGPARALIARVSETPKRPQAILDAVLGWVVRESEVFRPFPAARPLTLSARLIDWALVASALALALTYL